MQLDDFLARTWVSDGCWLWTSARSTAGYGVFRENRRLLYAHRWSHEHYKGPIRDGLEIDHLCGNRACVNPEHLEAVTHQENCQRGKAGKYLAEKTHCKHGHEFTEENTYLYRGSRFCRTCSRERSRKHYATHRSRPSTPDA